MTNTQAIKIICEYCEHNIDTIIFALVNDCNIPQVLCDLEKGGDLSIRPTAFIVSSKYSTDTRKKTKYYRYEGTKYLQNLIFQISKEQKEFICNFARHLMDNHDAPPKNTTTQEKQVSQDYSPNTIVNGNGNTVHVTYDTPSQDNKLFEDLIAITNNIENSSEILKAINEMKETVKTPNFKEKYKEFMSVISDHMTIFIPVLSELSKLL